MKKILVTWLPIAVAVTILCGLIEVTVQQNYRLSANDPQIQYSEDGARNFKNASEAASMVPQDKTDIAASLATFGIVYGPDGGLLASSAALDNQTPKLPGGVIEYTKKHGQDRFTWQPKNGVRIAAVITKADAGFVLIGRNMREVERRELSLDIMVLAGWLATLIGTFFVVWVLDFLGKKKPSKKAEKTV